MSLAIVIYSDRLIENFLPFRSYSALTSATMGLYIRDRLEQTGPEVEDKGSSPFLVQALLTSMYVSLLLNRDMRMLAILVTKLSIQSLTQCYFDLRTPSNSLPIHRQSRDLLKFRMPSRSLLRLKQLQTF